MTTDYHLIEGMSYELAKQLYLIANKYEMKLLKEASLNGLKLALIFDK